MDAVVNRVANKKAGNGKGKVSTERARKVQFNFNKKGKLTMKEKEEIKRTSKNGSQREV